MHLTVDFYNVSSPPTNHTGRGKRRDEVGHTHSISRTGAVCVGTRRRLSNSARHHHTRICP